MQVRIARHEAWSLDLTSCTRARGVKQEYLRLWWMRRAGLDKRLLRDPSVARLHYGEKKKKVEGAAFLESSIRELRGQAMRARAAPARCIGFSGGAHLPKARQLRWPRQRGREFSEVWKGFLCLRFGYCSRGAPAIGCGSRRGAPSLRPPISQRHMTAGRRDCWSLCFPMLTHNDDGTGSTTDRGSMS